MKLDIFNTDKKYNIIYCDPPWVFSSKELQRYGGKRFRPLTDVYNTEETSVMKNWDIGRIADKDCVVFMWTTDAHICEAIELMKAWGFKYVTVAFIWAKMSKHGKQLANLGAWTMKNCELVLLGTKGNMLKYKKQNNIQQLVYAERTKHSKKPNEVRERIVKLFGDSLPKIELFAREYVEGWDCWGDEV